MSSIEELRASISEVDEQVIALVAKRKEIALAIGNYKKQRNLPVFDAEREVLLHKFHDKISEKYNLAPEFIAKLFELLIEESRKVQQNEC